MNKIILTLIALLAVAAGAHAQTYVIRPIIVQSIDPTEMRRQAEGRKQANRDQQRDNTTELLIRDIWKQENQNGLWRLKFPKDGSTPNYHTPEFIYEAMRTGRVEYPTLKSPEAIANEMNIELPGYYAFRSRGVPE